MGPARRARDRHGLQERVRKHHADNRGKPCRHQGVRKEILETIAELREKITHELKMATESGEKLATTEARLFDAKRNG